MCDLMGEARERHGVGERRGYERVCLLVPPFDLRHRIPKHGYPLPLYTQNLARSSPVPSICRTLSADRRGPVR